MRRIISYNVNGLRAAISKGLIEWLNESNPDIVCFQELKMHEDQVDKLAFGTLGYHYQYWHCAEKKGYSGVAVVSKVKPNYVSIGTGTKKYDLEGRLIRLDFDDFTLINTYFPSGTTSEFRQAFKMEFLDSMMEYCLNLRKERPKIIICGDFNIAHKAIDINHPERHQKSPGFLPEERAWMDMLISRGFIDAFREFDERPEQYSWWSYRAGSRQRNIGWRLDYHFISSSLRNRLKSAGIQEEVVHSDHCPVFIDIEF